MRIRRKKEGERVKEGGERQGERENMEEEISQVKAENERLKVNFHYFS